MFDNKYDYPSFFEQKKELLELYDNVITTFIEYKSLDTIVNLITKVIKKDKVKLVYRAPLNQALVAKIYQMFH